MMYTTPTVVCVVLYLFYYLFRVVHKPTIVMKQTTANQLILEDVPLAKGRYWPPLLTFTTHLQTPLNVLLRLKPKTPVTYTRFTVAPLHDGGQMTIDRIVMSSTHSDTTNVALLTGLTGGSSELEILLMVDHLRSVGIATWVVNFRGQEDTPLLTSMYGECSSDDLHRCVLFICEQLAGEGNDAPLLGMGYSAGANVLAMYAGQMGRGCPLDGVLSVSNPFNLRACTTVKLKEPVQRHFYDTFFPPKRKAVVRAHKHLFEGKIDFDEMEKATGTREYDHAVTRKVSSHTGDTLDGMYAEHSSEHYIGGIQVPTLFFLALDDPFISNECIPDEQTITSNGYLQLITTEYGGHIAFMEGILGLYGPTWGERLCAQWILSVAKQARRRGDVKRLTATDDSSGFKKWIKSL